MISPALGNISGDAGLEVVSGGNEGGTNLGDNVVYCWNNAGNILWSVGPSTNALFMQGYASPILASFSTTQTPVFHALINVASVDENGDSDARVWLIRASDGYLYDQDPSPFNYPQGILGLPDVTPALIGRWDGNNMGFSIGSNYSFGFPPWDKVYAYNAQVINDSSHIEWGMYFHDPKHTGRHAQPAAGQIESDVAWYGRYILWGDVIIGDGATLRIEPGTRIEARDGFQIVVNPRGTLIVAGMPGNPVVFTSASSSPHAGIWGGIYMNEQAHVEIDTCVIEYAKDGIYAKAGTFLRVSQTAFKNCSDAGVFSAGSGNIPGHTVTNSNFYNCGTYAALFTEGNAHFNYCGVDGSTKYGLKYIGDGTIEAIGDTISTMIPLSSYWGIYIGPNTLGETPTPTLAKDSLMSFGQGGIYMEGAIGGSISDHIRSKHNGTYALYMKNTSASTVVNGLDASHRNTFSYSKYGIYCASGCNSNFRWNKVVQNPYGVYVDLGANPTFGITDILSGHNWIETTAPLTLYDMKNANTYTILARNNYWGTDGAQLIGPIDAGNPIPNPMPGTGWERRDISQAALPSEIVLNNYPNPFNSNTEIRFTLPQAGETSVKVYDITGRIVKDLLGGNLDAGEHSIIWDGTDLTGSKVSSGIYLYSVSTPQSRVTQKMVLLK